MDREEKPPNITLMAGLPGSGKSTAVRRIMSNLAGGEYIVPTKMIAAYQPLDHPEFDYIKRVRFVSK